MRNGFPISLVSMLLSAGLGFAQAPGVIPSTVPGLKGAGTDAMPRTPAVEEDAKPSDWVSPSRLDFRTGCVWQEECVCMPRFWASAEYLLWWVKDGPSNYPLLTTGPSAGQGILGAPGTVTLYGGSDFDFKTVSGLKLTIGLQEMAGPIGLEGSAFLLEHRAVGFSATTAPIAGPILARPFISQVPQGQPILAPNAPPPGSQSSTTALVPGLPTTAFTSVASTRLWGAEANVTSPWLATSRFTMRMLLGFRYLDLYEKLEDVNDFLAVRTQGNDRAGTPGSQEEDFHTRSQFYGGQVGAQGEASYGRFRVNILGKVALGNSHEVTAIHGTQILVPPPGGGPMSILPNALFAKASNIGVQQADAFAVVPEVGINVGYEMKRNVLLYAGYTFLYCSDAVRPGDQIDPNVNTLFPIAIGPAFPAPKFKHTDFWAQGVNFGLAMRF
jgi:hypothetical protein